MSLSFYASVKWKIPIVWVKRPVFQIDRAIWTSQSEILVCGTELISVQEIKTANWRNKFDQTYWLEFLNLSLNNLARKVRRFLAREQENTTGSMHRLRCRRGAESINWAEAERNSRNSHCLCGIFPPESKTHIVGWVGGGWRWVGWGRGAYFMASRLLFPAPIRWDLVWSLGTRRKGYAIRRESAKSWLEIEILRSSPSTYCRFTEESSNETTNVSKSELSFSAI